MAEHAVVAAYLWTALPAVVLQCLGWNSQSDVAQELLQPRAKHAVEFFCGTGALATALSQAGMRCDWFDSQLEPLHDILTVTGIAAAVRMVLAVMPGGVAWFGVPCSTFVWMARGHTKRSYLNPLGDGTRVDVSRANAIARIVTMLCRVLSMRGVFFVMEQPSGSLLWQVPCMRLAARRLRVKGWQWSRRFVWLGHFGHKINKPTELRGIFPNLAQILPSKRPRGQSAVGVYRVWTSKKNGRRRVGGSAGLKSTEHYPKRFCQAVTREIRKCIARHLK